jgi:ribosomal protein S18 acetylase RimI-like enzyme
VPLLLSLTGDQGELLAGLYARIYYSWMFVELLWVEEEARGRGLGAKLLAEAEDQARQQGCHSVWLDTFSFQAPEFYRRQGYEVFGELPNYPAEHRRYFLSKKINLGS